MNCERTECMPSCATGFASVNVDRLELLCSRSVVVFNGQVCMACDRLDVVEDTGEASATQATGPQNTVGHECFKVLSHVHEFV